MPPTPLPGQLFVTHDAAHVAEAAALRIARALRRALRANGKASLALSGGNTPRPAYEQLAAAPDIDWSRVSVYWIDERAAAPTSDRSNYRLARESLLSRAPIPDANVHRMKGDAADLDAAAREYEADLRASLALGPGGAPSFDAAVLGIGDDGHTASLFPGEHLVEVTDRLVVSVPASPARKTEARLTVTAPVIQSIGTLVVLAVGAAKHGPLERAWAREGTLVETPSRLFRTANGDVTWIVDKAAGGFA